jgi:hypothetical protein
LYANQSGHVIAAVEQDMPVLFGVGIDGGGVDRGIPLAQKRDQSGQKIERVGR